MLFDPVADAVAAESMLAWEFNTFRTFLALVKADIAVSFFARLLRGQISDELLGAAICRCWALRSHTHAQAMATEDLIEKVLRSPAVLAEKVAKHVELIIHLRFLSGSNELFGIWHLLHLGHSVSRGSELLLHLRHSVTTGRGVGLLNAAVGTIADGD